MTIETAPDTIADKTKKSGKTSSPAPENIQNRPATKAPTKMGAPAAAKNAQKSRRFILFTYNSGTSSARHISPSRAQ